MKVVYIILLSFICALNAFANNEYQSFVKDGKSWHYAIGSRSYCYKIQGDTIIEILLNFCKYLILRNY